jgi:hypothetical protein
VVHHGPVGRGGGRLARVRPCQRLRGRSIVARGQKGGGDVGEPVRGDDLAWGRQSWPSGGDRRQQPVSFVERRH